MALGMTELLLDSDLDPDQRHLVETVRQSGEGLIAIINDILDISKIEAGKLVLEERPFDPEKTLETQLELLAEIARRRGLDLVAAVAPGLPGMVLGDQARFRQILSNLLGNALKFTERGHVLARLELARSAGRDYLELTVEDTGVGIAPAALERIFDNFEQAERSTARHYGGTGLGLAICRRLTEWMGGSIDVRSQPGVGSVFQVRIPAVPIEGAAGTQPQALAGRRILIVDAHAVTGRLLTDYLRQWGAQVRTLSPSQWQEGIAAGMDLLINVRHADPAGSPVLPPPALPVLAIAPMPLGEQPGLGEQSAGDSLPLPFRRRQRLRALCRMLERGDNRPAPQDAPAPETYRNCAWVLVVEDNRQSGGIAAHAGKPWLPGGDSRQWPRGGGPCAAASLGSDPDGWGNAGNGWRGGHAPYPRRRGRRFPGSGGRGHRACPERRPAALPGGRHGRLSGQAVHPAAAYQRAATLGAGGRGDALSRFSALHFLQDAFFRKQARRAPKSSKIPLFS